MQGQAPDRQMFKILTNEQAERSRGAAVESADTCPFCNARVQPGADICEHCSKWILEGKCCYCYGPVKPEQKFCGRCGNSPRGITCKNCGTTSHFDYCTNCNTPLSKRAIIALNAIDQDPEIQAIKNIIVEQPSPKKPQANNELKQLNDYFTSTEEVKKKPSGFSFGAETEDLSMNLAQHTDTGQPVNDNQEDVATAMLKELQAKMFEDNQSARLYYSTIKLKIPELKKHRTFTILGWQCKYSGAVHFDGPEGCACASMGGRWISKEEVQWVSVESFVLEGDLYSPGAEIPKAANSQTNTP